MDELSADFLLSNPDLVRPAAPWCGRLDNLELTVAALALPWIAGEGLRRAELEQQISRLADELPVGPTYFQRINRATAALVERKVLARSGGGRGHRFALTPEGFAALVLNLCVLHADPTLDGSEFEIKRALVAVWHQLHQRLLDWPDERLLTPEVERFLDRVEAVTVWGHAVVTDDLVDRALDVFALVDRQRAHVRKLRREAARQEERAAARAELLARAGPPEIAAPAVRAPAAGGAELLEVVRVIAGSSVPRLQPRAKALRYEAYLRYLDALDDLHSRELKVVNVNMLRAAASGRRG